MLYPMPLFGAFAALRLSGRATARLTSPLPRSAYNDVRDGVYLADVRIRHRGWPGTVFWPDLCDPMTADYCCSRRTGIVEGIVMAKRTIHMLVDDIDGGEADETVRFAVDGLQYEIDLSKKNATKMRDALARYIEAGSKVGRASGGTARATAGAGGDRPRWTGTRTGPSGNGPRARASRCPTGAVSSRRSSTATTPRLAADRTKRIAGPAGPSRRTPVGRQASGPTDTSSSPGARPLLGGAGRPDSQRRRGDRTIPWRGNPADS